MNGYTQPSLNDLHRLIVGHGGGFLQYLDQKTAATHIIAGSLTPKKREEFRKYRIVKPAWVVDSIEAGRLLPWDSYRVIDEGPSQKTLKLGGDGGRVASEGRSQSGGYREQSDSSWYTWRIQQSAEPAENGESASIAAGPFSGGDNPTETDLQDDPIVLPSVKVSSPTTPEHEATPEPGGFTAGTTKDQDKTGQPEMEIDPSIASKSPDRGGVAGREISPDRGDTGGDTELTSEEYNAQLLQNPQFRNSSVVNPDFIQQFFRESRLHHLSTWKAELKAQLQGSAQERAATRRPQKRRAPMARRYIMHVDFDSFFPAVSIRKQNPDLADKPVAVAHGTGPGSEIASCNYPARTFGVRNGMWMKGALEMCPDLKVLPYDFPAYEDASRKFYDAILDTDGIVQSVSIDEALVDITAQCLDAGGSDGRGISEGSIWREQDMADKIAQDLRDSVKEKTGCDVSVGIGGNILQAKLALRKAKPAGQFQLKPDVVLDYIGDLTVQNLPGVAYSLGAKLEEMGVKFVKDIRGLTKESLTSHLGPKTGTKLWDYARGVDHTEVGDEGIRKSVSAEINWGIRFVSQSQADEFVHNLCDELHRRLVENVVKGKQLTMRIMRRSADAPREPPKHLGHGKCDTFNRSVALGVATNASDVIGKEAVSMLRSFNFSPGDLRGLGVQMTKLEPVKPTSSGELESSQRQLQFKPSSPARKRVNPLDPDEIDSPKKGEGSARDVSEQANMGPSLDDASQKPLNITGTQFIMPSQADPNVLSELPADIRSKLATEQKQQRLDSTGGYPLGSRTAPPSDASSAPPILPPQSQLDQETLDALPDDVRAEVLGYYERQTPGSPSAQPASPGSAGRRAPASRPKTVTTPTKSRTVKRRTRPVASKSTGNPTLLQSNFLLPTPSGPTTRPGPLEDASNAPAAPDTDANEEISSDVLAALPEDIRQEVLEQHKRTRLQKRVGLNIPQKSRRPGSKATGTLTTRRQEQKALSLPPRPAKPTFTSKKLSTLPELREALSQWYDSFKDGIPYEEDVMTLANYLKRVVVEEKDIAKAVAVANWLAWLVANESPSSPAGEQAGEAAATHGWQKAVETVREELNSAARERGLAALEFA